MPAITVVYILMSDYRNRKKRIDFADEASFNRWMARLESGRQAAKEVLEVRRYEKGQ